MALCPLGINGTEYPHWPVERICEFAVGLKARYVELAVGRIVKEGTERIRQTLAGSGLKLTLNSTNAEIVEGMKVAHALEASIVVLGDVGIERPTESRTGSIEAFRRVMRELLENPAYDRILVALENSVIRLSRQPEDLMTIVRAVDHLRFGVNYDPDNYYNAGIEGYPYAYELVRGHIFHVHAKDSARYIPAVHGEHKRVLHRAGGNMVCVPIGSGAMNWTGIADRLRCDGYTGPISLEPHNLPDEMAPSMEKDAAFLRSIGLVA
jgi:sugar phosphate isomerase/epimerase